MELGLDFDIPVPDKKGHDNIDAMPSAIQYLIRRFGKNRVLIRRTSSGQGYHIRVVDTNITPKEELALRLLLKDCNGRRIADKGRLVAGMRTSRLFKYKGLVKISDDYSHVESVTTRRAGVWKSCTSKMNMMKR